MLPWGLELGVIIVIWEKKALSLGVFENGDLVLKWHMSVIPYVCNLLQAEAGGFKVQG
jgi:hypothetical protein